MAVTLLQPAETWWECPNCTFTDVTRQAGPHSRFHNCKGMRGLSAPMVPAGTKAKVVARERDDYVGSEKPHLDGEGRPIMSIVTTRDDGEDAAVLVPMAQASMRGVL